MKRSLVVVVGVLAMSATRAEAWNPIKAAAAKLKSAGRAFVESAASPVIHNAEDAGHRLIADVDSAIANNLQRTGALVTQVKAEADATLAQVDQSLQARILQIQTGVDHTVDHAFDRIDLAIGRLETDAQQLLARVDQTGQDLISQLDKTAAANLAKIDKIFTSGVNNVQLLVASSIQQADDVAQQRLAQLDEVAGRRLGNLDVIATKQSLSLEGMLVRIATLIGLVGLIAFVAWRMFRELADALALANVNNAPRLRAIGRQSMVRLAPQLALAGAGVLALYGLSKALPRDSENRAQQQTAQHEAAFDVAARALDVIEARYHESQLEILESSQAPEKLAGYRGRLAKVELLHSLFTRPGQLYTQQGLANLVAEVGEVEEALRAVDRHPDPDVMIAKAFVLWQVGGTRDDEYEAAMLCAHALEHPEGVLLAPLARNYISAFLADPYVPKDAANPSLAELAKLAAMPPRKDETTQFDHVIEFDHLIKKLDRDSTAAYLDMVEAQGQLGAALAIQPKGPDSPAVGAARAARTTAANKLIAAWAAFDQELEASTSFASDAMVLSVFTLDDAVLSRARYYVAEPSANGLPPMLTDPSAGKALSPVLRARIAPLRVAWGQRYAALLGPHARDIVSYEETRRFEMFEQRADAFEKAYSDFLAAARTGVDPAKLMEIATQAATRASDMGLYRDTEAGRVTEASRILAIAANRGHGGQASSEVPASIALNYGIRRLRFL